VLCGLTLSHGPGHIACALLEAIAFAVRHNLETFEGAGAVGWDDDWSAIDHEVEPRSEHAELYEELYGRYRELYPATRDVVYALARNRRRGCQRAGRGLRWRG
jgi:xylulokinase